MRYESPKLTSGVYRKVIIDPVVYYPTPKPNENVDAATLEQIRKYYDQTLRQKIGAQVPVVDKAGRDVVQMRVAITAVEADEANLKAYQYLPIGLAITGTMHATGTRDQYAQIFTEIEVLESQTGERLAALVRKGTDAEVEKAKEGADKGQKKVTLDNVKPLLDGWASLAANFAGKYLRAQ